MKMHVLRTGFLLGVCLIFCFACEENPTEPDPDPISIRFESVHVSMYGGSDGSIDLTVTGGVEPYQYQWSNGEATEDIHDLTPGVYSVTVTDARAETKTDSIEITQPNETGTVTDIDGNVYRTVRIGDQWWMAENLRVTHNPQGDTIPSYHPDNNVLNVDAYGRLYTWQAVMDSSEVEGSRGIAPVGWHIPMLAEWDTLIACMGGEDVAAAKLKEQGTAHWTTNEGATNSSGFTAVPAGGYGHGHYDGFGSATHYWSSTGSSNEAYMPSIWEDLVYTLFEDENVTASIRCIKDE